MAFIFANYVNTTLAAASSNTATTITLSDSTYLPALSAGQQMPLKLTSVSGSLHEIVYVTSIAGAVCTVTRGQEGTTAQNWSVGDYVQCGPTAGTLQIGASTGASLIGYSSAMTVEEQLDILFYGVANVQDKQWSGGAKGDGTTDDTTAILAAKASGKMLYFPTPSVKYLITATITLLANQRVFGDSKYDKGIYANMTAPIFTLGDGSDSTLRYFGFRDIYVRNDGGSVIKSRLSTNWNALNCTFVSFAANRITSGFVKTDAGGTGYTLNDVLTVVGGTSTVAATFKVTSVSAGVVKEVTLLTNGTYTALPECTLPDGVSVTGGTGTGCQLEVFGDATIDTQQTYRVGFYNCDLQRSGTGFALSLLDNSNVIEFSNCSISGGSAGGVADIGRSYCVTFNTCVTEVSKFGIRAGTNPDATYGGEVNALTILGYSWEQVCEPLRVGDYYAVRGFSMRGSFISNSSKTSLSYRDSSIKLGRVDGLEISGNSFSPATDEYIFNFWHVLDTSSVDATIDSGKIHDNAYASNGLGWKLSGQYSVDATLANQLPKGLYMEFGVQNKDTQQSLVGDRIRYTTGAVVPTSLTNTGFITTTGTTGAYIEKVELLSINPSADLDGVLIIGYNASSSANLSTPVKSRTITGAADNGSGLIRITSNAHGYINGQSVTISGVTGTTEANGTWTISNVATNTYDLVGSTFTHAYVSGGTSTLFTWTNTGYGYYADITSILTTKYCKVSDYLLLRLVGAAGTGTLQVNITYRK